MMAASPNPVAETAPSPAEKPLRILLLEDNAADAALISNELERSGMRIQVTQVDSSRLIHYRPKTFCAGCGRIGPFTRPV